MKKYTCLVFLVLFIGQSCQKDEDFLDREPTHLIGYDAVWEDQELALAAVADLYARIPEYQSLEAWPEFANFNEAFASSQGDYWRHHNTEWGYGDWGFWPYGLIRDINLFIEAAETTDDMEENENELAAKRRFLAEARFIRATVYFELVKRMGGVPIILQPLEYDFSGDPTYLQKPRNEEHEVYDFIIAEMDSIKERLPVERDIKTRATKWLALALQSRAALYAGSIAKHGANTPSVSLPGGEVGIPVDMADNYYQTALSAAEEIINTGPYTLYLENPNDLEDNFANIFLDKNGNSEVMFVKDYQLQSGVIHNYTLYNLPLSMAEQGNGGGRLNPSLNLVQSFELLDNTFAPLATHNSDGEYIYYDNPEDIFENRDARLGGTVLHPGSTFKGEQVDIWAGLYLPEGNVISAGVPGGRAVVPGEDEEVQVVGFDGPVDGFERSAQTGFYIRKHLDPTPGAGQDGTQSEVWWVRYRYGEVLLNAAEAAFELGDKETATQYLNPLRERAGFTIPLTASDITFDRIVHEREVELAFEGHQLWDMKRWRLAHVVWNGTNHPLTDNPGEATEPSTRPFGLWPYKVYDPESPGETQWVFETVVPREVVNPDRFRLGNYYSWIGDDLVSQNPNIVRNPNH